MSNETFGNSSFEESDFSPNKKAVLSKNDTVEDQLRGIIANLEDKLKDEVKTRIDNQNDLRTFMLKKGEELKDSLLQEFENQTKDIDSQIEDMATKINKTEIHAWGVIDHWRLNISKFKSETKENLHQLKQDTCVNSEKRIYGLKSGMYKDNVALINWVKDTFSAIKADRNKKIDEFDSILHKFSNVYSGKGEFEAHAFEELMGIKSSLVDEREIRIKEDKHLLDEVNVLLDSLTKTDVTPASP